jgi:hypothetical protein
LQKAEDFRRLIRRNSTRDSKRNFHSIKTADRAFRWPVTALDATVQAKDFSQEYCGP